MVTLGYSHKFNGLKFRILEALMWADEPLTVRDIEYKTGIHCTNISSAMSHYQKLHKKNGKTIKLPYIERLEKKGPNGLYRYRITKKGKEAYIAYLSRIKDGKILNRFRYPDDPDRPIKKIKTREGYTLQPEQLLPYVKINKNGLKMGLSKPEHALYWESCVKHHNSIPESQRRKKEAAKASMSV